MGAPIYVYASLSDLATAINPAALAGVSTDLQNGALADASAKIDSFLRSQFVLPLTKVGADVKRACVNIAIYYVMVARGYNPEAGGDPGIRDRYSDEMKWLAQVSTGTAVPDVTDSSPGGTEGEVAARPVVISSSQRGFSSRGSPCGKTDPFQGD